MWNHFRDSAETLYNAFKLLETLAKVPIFEFKALYDKRNNVEAAMGLALLKIKECDRKKFDLNTLTKEVNTKTSN